MVSIGIKGPINTAGELDYARQHGVTVITAEDYRAHGLAPAQHILDKIATHPTYFTFDIDVVDPVFAPGTGTPSVGGLTSAEAIALVRSFARYRPKLVGADLVEVLPDRDIAGNTALLAAHIAFEIIALGAIQRR
jgi:arginase family enzyme